MVLATRTWNLALVACLSLACGYDEGFDQDDGAAGTTDDGGDEGADTTGEDGADDGVPAGCSVPAMACPDDRPELGAAGEYRVDAFSTEWTWDDECEASVGTPVYVEVPADTVSLSAAIDAGATETAFGYVGNGDRVFVDMTADGVTSFYQAPLKHGPTAVSTFVLPSSDDTYPEAGCLALLPVALDDLSGETSQVHLVSRRYDGDGSLGVNLVVVDGAQIDQADLDAATQVMVDLYSNNDAAAIGDVVRVDITTDAGPFIEAEGEDVEALRASMAGADHNRMNLFFISDFTDEPGTLGIAAGIPGPNGVHGTVASGVVMALDAHLDEGGSLDATLLGETMAHEMGHQMGLPHTSEADGSDHDLAGDTPQCTIDMDADGDGQLSAEECPDGLNVMFWTAGDQSQQEMSSIQSDIIFFSPVTL
ncbi:MAG: zinc-dependent metalloprotease family protein [Myxococcota bacterium]